jgi:hypothetical protein
LRALEHDSSAGPAVARLGAAIHATMSEPHRLLRVPELIRAMSNDRLGGKPPQVLVHTLVTAIGGTA